MKLRDIMLGNLLLVLALDWNEALEVSAKLIDESVEPMKVYKPLYSSSFMGWLMSGLLPNV